MMKCPDNLVKIIADSINPNGDRITTMIVKLPRFLLAELNTHRCFSRNSASSRAIPLSKMIERVQNDPFIPFHWYKNQSGMQGNINEPLSDKEVKLANKEWLKALNNSIESAKLLGGIESTVITDNFGYNQSNFLDIHKSIPNRLLEPFMWTEVLITATDFTNFFSLRCPKVEYEVILVDSNMACSRWKTNDLREIKDLGATIIDKKITYLEAEPHFQDIALQMKEAYELAEPDSLFWGEYHIPFGDKIDSKELNVAVSNVFGWVTQKDLEEAKLKISVARCARISYLTQDNEINYVKDLDLYNRLINNKHASPTEHIALAVNENWIDEQGGYMIYDIENLSNFNITWKQYRKIIENDNI